MKNIILIDKPIGLTSNDVVCKIKKVYGYKKVGHAGTLDPQASGLLVIGINRGTKLLANLLFDDKQYEATFTFGIKTNTGDAQGKIIKKCQSHVTLTTIKKASKFFLTNEYYQTPPIFSAKKINGIRAYKLALASKKVKLKPQLVKIKKMKIIKFDAQQQTLKIVINVTKGFYVRSFCNDFAKKLKTIAYVSALRRTKSGKYDLKHALSLDTYLCQNKPIKVV
ncbi:tRNA pseudouridine(55) synthase TruB [bacterium]|nr:tRNA pseudouridine(55) synthase TruB [bacterium]